jgi:BirA family biotin operon repressor/biotin-[acetyl-CoA-carboxylase] ligase
MAAQQSNNNKTATFAHRANNFSKQHLSFRHIPASEPVNSTQDEARRLLLKQHASFQKDPAVLAVQAEIQFNGRGTQGRRWERGGEDDVAATAADGNVYITICIPMEHIPVTITLLPLQIGVLVAQRIAKLIAACRPNEKEGDDARPQPKVTVKWPNDVLVNDQKISGTLIENEIIDNKTTWMLIGIGINVATAPRNLSRSPGGGMHKRAACCVQDFCETELPAQTALVLGQDLASALTDWVTVVDGGATTDNKLQRERQVVDNWRAFAEFGKQYELRGQVVDEENGGYQGEKVVAVGIENDGQLRVRGEDGRERLLIAEYMF